MLCFRERKLPAWWPSHSLDSIGLKMRNHHIQKNSQLFSISKGRKFNLKGVILEPFYKHVPDFFTLALARVYQVFSSILTHKQTAEIPIPMKYSLLSRFVSMCLVDYSSSVLKLSTHKRQGEQKAVHVLK